MSSAGSTIDFERSHFTGQSEFAAALLQRVLDFVTPRSKPRLLDLGCGTGALAIAAARAKPDLQAVALDISPPNVSAARTAADQAGVGPRVETVCANFWTWDGGTFDTIVSDSVLHLIGGTDETLAARLCKALAPGGMLFATVPVESPGNSARFLARRLWRLTPPAADRLVLAVGRRLYPNLRPEVIVDRVPYMRLLPDRLYGKRMVTTFARHHLDVVAAERCANTSIAKPDHDLVTWRRSNDFSGSNSP